MQTVHDIFTVWPSAAALGRAIGVAPVTVRQWRNRNRSIPVRYWAVIIEAADKRGVKLCPEDFFLPAEAE